jgi:hypothetical protein
MDRRTIRVSFEITDNWEIEGFRNFIKILMSDDSYDVFIISNDDSSAYITKTGENIGLPTENVIICNFTADKTQAIIDNRIDIHFDNLQSFILLVDETTDAYGVMVTYNLNKYYLRPDYVITFERLIAQIIKDEQT